MKLIFKSEILIYPSKANLDVYILFGGLLVFWAQKFKKMQRVCMGVKIPHLILVYD